ncbi:MAG: hypothetical protein AAB966_01130 [Patescibacteria group bacterium]
MKRTKLNLLGAREQSRKLDQYSSWLRLSLLGITVTFALFVLSFAVINVFQSNRRTQLQRTKNQLISELSAKRENESKLIRLSNKLSSYNEFQKDDARFLPYFNLLQETLKEGSQSGVLSGFKVTKDRDVEFEIQFEDVDAMLNSFRFIETDEFLSKFDTLSLSNFSRVLRSLAGESETSIRLTFKGQFINLNQKQQ